MLRGELEGDDLEQHVRESIVTTTLDKAVGWARGNALFPATFGLACCAIEMMSIVAARVDVARFGFEAFRASPRQADLLILSGRVSIKMAPVVRRIYDQMLEPKYAIAMGACSSSMGVFNNYAIVPADKFMPVDVHVPGCPPRPEALMHGILKLRSMIQDDPTPGLARALQRRRHRGARARRADRQPGRQRLPAGGHRGCLTRRASSCSPRSCARPAGRASATPSTSAARPRCTSSPPRSARRCSFLREQGLRLPGQRARPGLLPRGAAPRRALRAADMADLDRITVKLRVPARRPARGVGHARLADGRPPGARGLRHVRRGLRRPPRPAPHPHARGLRGLSRSAATSRSAASRSSSPRTRPSGATTRHDRASRTTAARRRRSTSPPRASRWCSGDGLEQELLTLNFGPAPPRHARGAAAAGDARGRGRARPQADHRLRPHRHREDGRGQELLEGHPRRRADGLPRLLLQRDGLLRRRRDAARASRSPSARSTCASSTSSSTGS